MPELTPTSIAGIAYLGDRFRSITMGNMDLGTYIDMMKSHNANMFTRYGLPKDTTEYNFGLDQIPEALQRISHHPFYKHLVRLHQPENTDEENPTNYQRDFAEAWLVAAERDDFYELLNKLPPTADATHPFSGTMFWTIGPYLFKNLREKQPEVDDQTLLCQVIAWGSTTEELGDMLPGFQFLSESPNYSTLAFTLDFRDTDSPNELADLLAKEIAASMIEVIDNNE